MWIEFGEIAKAIRSAAPETSSITGITPSDTKFRPMFFITPIRVFRCRAFTNCMSSTKFDEFVARTRKPNGQTVEDVAALFDQFLKDNCSYPQDFPTAGGIFPDTYKENFGGGGEKMTRRPRLPDEEQMSILANVQSHVIRSMDPDATVYLFFRFVPPKGDRLIVELAGHLVGAFLGSASADEMQILGFFKPLLDYVKQPIEQLRIWSERDRAAQPRETRPEP